MTRRERAGNWMLLILIVILIASVLQLWNGGSFIPLPIADLSLAETTARLTTLFIAATFIERAVEVIVTPWREEESNHLELSLKDAAAEQVPGAQRALVSYKSTTQGMAFMVAGIMGVLVSLVGVRGIEMFLKADFWKSVLAGIPTEAVTLQYHLFTLVDVLITGALLAGGADGIHRVTSLIIDFLSTTRDKVNGSPGASPPSSMAGTPANAGTPTALPTSPGALHVAEGGA